MHRPRSLWFLLITPALLVLVLSAAGCGGSEHDQMIRKFFSASAYGDNATVANIATVVFDPDRNGRAQNVSFVSETIEQTRALNIKVVDAAFKEAQAAEQDFSKRMREYQDKNIDAINRVLKAEAAKARLGGKDAEVQAAWTRWRDEGGGLNKKVSEARIALAGERKVADLSTPNHDATTFDVTEATKEVTVTANVRMADGKSTNKTLVLTLQRVVLKDSTGKLTEGKWLITALKESGAAQ